MAGRRRWTAWASLAIVVAGIGLRLPGAFEPYSQFHPARQYRDAIVARDLTYRLWGAPDATKGHLARLATDEWGAIEAPIVEGVAALLHVDVASRWWRIRLVEVAGYTAGMVFLGSRLRRRLGTAAGLTGLGVGMLLPYGVLFSTSFQPEPLLVGAIAGATGLLVTSGEGGLGRSDSRWFGVLGGLAGLLKLTAIPVLLLPWAWLHRRSLRSRSTAAVVGLVVGPALAWLAAGLVVGDFLESQTEGRFVPRLLLRRSFWTGWSHAVSGVLGWWLVAIAAAGVAMGPRRVRDVVVPSAVGYVAVGLTFSHLISSHAYYSVIAIPAIVVGAAGLAAAVHAKWSSLPHAAVVVGVVAVMVLALVNTVTLTRDYLDSGTDRSATVAGDYIAGTLDESVALTLDDGAGLEYLTRSRVAAWPTAADIELARDTDLRLDTGPALLSDLRGRGTRWFIITIPAALPLVPDLVELLEPFPVVTCDPDAIVVDLRAEGPGQRVGECGAMLNDG